MTLIELMGVVVAPFGAVFAWAWNINSTVKVQKALNEDHYKQLGKKIDKLDKRQEDLIDFLIRKEDHEPRYSRFER